MEMQNKFFSTLLQSAKERERNKLLMDNLKAPKSTLFDLEDAFRGFCSCIFISSILFVKDSSPGSHMVFYHRKNTNDSKA